MEESMKKHIQSLSVFQWVLTFLLMGIFFTTLLIYMMFTSFWIVPMVYFTWLLFDWNTPERGVRPWLAILAGLFRLPVYRDYLMSAGMVPVSKDSLQFLLTRCGLGNAVFIVVGGAAESLQSIPGKHTVTLSGRKGFVRLALQHGADLVPVYSFGENELYEQVSFSPQSWGWWLQRHFKKYVGFAPCVFKGRGVFSAGSWGINPFPRPVTTVVGRPICIPHSPVPSEEEVDHYHALYMKGLSDLFHNYKVSCGLSESDSLEIL